MQRYLGVFRYFSRYSERVWFGRSLYSTKKIRILPCSGVKGIALKLFKPYLTNRHQKVKIDDTFCKEIMITNYSISRGTVLEPILFIIYINSLLT